MTPSGRNVSDPVMTEETGTCPPSLTSTSKGERSQRGTSSPVQFQLVPEPFEIEIESLLPPNRWEFTVFTHAHTVIEGEVEAAGGLLPSSRAPNLRQSSS